MKKIFTCAAILMSALILFSFNSFSQWPARYNGPANGSDHGTLIQVDANGNVIVCGPSESKKTKGVTKYNDYVVIKYNPSGSAAWVGRYNGTASGDDYPLAMVLDDAGNVFVTGRSRNAQGNFDYATVKFNASSGAVEWSHRYNGPQNLHDWGNDIKIVNGFIYVTGQSDGVSSGIVDGFNGNSISTIKIDPNGNTVWTKLYNGVTDTYDGAALSREDGMSIDLDALGFIYIGGSKGGGGENGLLLKYSDDATNDPVNEKVGGLSRIRKISIDNNGNINVAGFGFKAIQYNPNLELNWEYIHNTYYQDMTLDNNGDLYIVAHTNSSTQLHNYETFKINGNDGSLAWHQTFNSPEQDNPNAITVDQNGNVYVTGQITFIYKRSKQFKYGTIKYDNNGNFQWAEFYDSPENLSSVANDVAVDANGNVYVTGRSATKSYGDDIVTVRYTTSTSSRQRSEVTELYIDKPVKQTAIQINFSPNPVKDLLTIRQTGKSEPLIYNIYDIATNMLVAQGKFSGKTQVNLNAQRFGTYIIIIKSEKTGAELRQLFLKE